MLCFAFVGLVYSRELLTADAFFSRSTVKGGGDSVSIRYSELTSPSVSATKPNQETGKDFPLSATTRHLSEDRDYIEQDIQ
jgi:hypothetical protein